MNCKYYEAIVETGYVGVYPDGTPIEGQELVGEICHKKNTYDFDCNNCAVKEEYKVIVDNIELPF